MQNQNPLNKTGFCSQCGLNVNESLFEPHANSHPGETTFFESMLITDAPERVINES